VRHASGSRASARRRRWRVWQSVAEAIPCVAPGRGAAVSSAVRSRSVLRARRKRIRSCRRGRGGFGIALTAAQARVLAALELRDPLRVAEARRSPASAGSPSRRPRRSGGARRGRWPPGDAAAVRREAASPDTMPGVGFRGTRCSRLRRRRRSDEEAASAATRRRCAIPLRSREGRRKPSLRQRGVRRPAPRARRARCGAGPPAKYRRPGPGLLSACVARRAGRSSRTRGGASSRRARGRRGRRRTVHGTRRRRGARGGRYHLREPALRGRPSPATTSGRAVRGARTPSAWSVATSRIGRGWSRP
jgi:hypothetical protein